MKSYIQLVYRISIILVIVVFSAWAQDPDKIREAYQEAKMLCINQKWTEAISLFDQFLEKYPDSKYEDDVIFWIGYSQEQLPGQKKEAFNTYSRLVNNYPQSTWVDDALNHQVIIAEEFILTGNDNYKIFLNQLLNNEYKDVRYRAAIALAKVGAKNTLPILAEMQNNEDYGDEARDLIIALNTDRLSVDDQKNKYDEKKTMDLTYSEDQVKKRTEEEKGFLVFDTKRYEQYRSMLRKDNDWSRDELVNFALWHILDTDEFEEYKSLATDYDKNEWRRKFWKRRDPTPTTEENEMEKEFQRRINYSRENFAQFWNYLNFKYLPDQHMRLGWPHAPWDARGELYIKYGEPDVRSNQGFHQEVWTYNRYSVDFLVKQYMTNIFGNAITAGELSYQNYGSIGGQLRTFDHLNPLSSVDRLTESLWNNVNSYVQTNFIFNQEIRYAHDYKANLIEEIKLFYDNELSLEKNSLVFLYQLPVDEFKIVKTSGGSELRYKEIYCVLDEDLREVAKSEINRRIGNIPNDDYVFKESILLNLPQGKYTLHLRIEDQNDDNLGIFSQEFEVSQL